MQYDITEMKAHPFILLTEWFVSFTAIFVSWVLLPLPYLGQIITLFVVFTIFLQTRNRCIIPVYITLVLINSHYISNPLINLVFNLAVVAMVWYSAYLSRSIFSSFRLIKNKVFPPKQNFPTTCSGDEAKAFSNYLANNFLKDSDFPFLASLQEIKDQYASQQYAKIHKGLSKELSNNLTHYLNTKLSLNPPPLEDKKIYSDAISTATLHKLISPTKELTSSDLKAAYSYVKCYQSGDSIEAVTTRTHAEIVVIIYIQNIGGQHSIHISKGNQQYTLQPSEGDIVIFDASTSQLTQSPFTGEKQVVMFLHYQKS